MEEPERFETDDMPSWAKTGLGILTFVAITIAVLLVCAFLFFIVVRFGLWAFGVL